MRKIEQLCVLGPLAAEGYTDSLYVELWILGVGVRPGAKLQL